MYAVSHVQRTRKRAMLSTLRLILAVASFCIYAFAVLHQGNYLKMGCYADCADALPGAVSYIVYGTKLGKVEREVERVFHTYAGIETAARAIEGTNKGSIPTGETRIALDGSGISYCQSCHETVWSSLA